MSQYFLVINGGSSSLKYALYNAGDLALAVGGSIVSQEGKLHLKVKKNAFNLEAPEPLSEAFSIHQGLSWLLAWLERQDFQFKAVGHRVVHGGEDYDGAVIVNEQHLEKLESFSRLAPLHQPHNLAAIKLLQERFPDCTQIVCFDTAFHRSVSPVYSTYTLPAHLREQGLKRYGFHGLAYEYVVHYFRENHPDIAEGKILAAHLGSGSSACAIEKGRSVDSSMGFTAVDGLPMGTRCGAIDAGLMHYLFDQLQMDAKQVQKLIYKESGLLGLSGLSADMRDLLAADTDEARLAVDHFVYQVVKQFGSLQAVMGGVDAIAFSGGIGENAPIVREKIMESFSRCLNGKQVPVVVVPVDEEWIIAKNLASLVS